MPARANVRRRCRPLPPPRSKSADPAPARFARRAPRQRQRLPTTSCRTPPSKCRVASSGALQAGTNLRALLFAVMPRRVHTAVCRRVRSIPNPSSAPDFGRRRSRRTSPKCQRREPRSRCADLRRRALAALPDRKAEPRWYCWSGSSSLSYAETSTQVMGVPGFGTVMSQLARGPRASAAICWEEGCRTVTESCGAVNSGWMRGEEHCTAYVMAPLSDRRRGPSRIEVRHRTAASEDAARVGAVSSAARGRCIVAFVWSCSTEPHGPHFRRADARSLALPAALATTLHHGGRRHLGACCSAPGAAGACTAGRRSDRPPGWPLPHAAVHPEVAPPGRQSGRATSSTSWRGYRSGWTPGCGRLPLVAAGLPAARGRLLAPAATKRAPRPVALFHVRERARQAAFPVGAGEATATDHRVPLRQQGPPPMCFTGSTGRSAMRWPATSAARVVGGCPGRLSQLNPDDARGQKQRGPAWPALAPRRSLQSYFDCAQHVLHGSADLRRPWPRQRRPSAAWRPALEHARPSGHRRRPKRAPPGGLVAELRGAGHAGRVAGRAGRFRTACGRRPRPPCPALQPRPPLRRPAPRRPARPACRR